MSTMYTLLKESTTWLSEREIPHAKAAYNNMGWITIPNIGHALEQLLEHINSKLPDNYSSYSRTNGGKTLVVVSDRTLTSSEINDIAESTIIETGLKKKLTDIFGECYSWPTGGIDQSSPTMTKGGWRKRKKTRMRLSEALNEALDGIGAEFQPQDILRMMGLAMKKMNLSQKMQDAQVKVGISKDKQFITFTKQTGDGGVPLLQYAVQELAEPKAIEAALNQIIDVCSGDAPGAGDLKREQLKKVEKAIKHLASQHSIKAKAEQQQAEQEPMQPVGV